MPLGICNDRIAPLVGGIQYVDFLFSLETSCLLAIFYSILILLFFFILRYEPEDWSIKSSHRKNMESAVIFFLIKFCLK